jgi:membrane protease YdiL (CAAX protease family)
MKDLEIPMESKSSTMAKLWQKIPVVMKAIIVGFIVNTLGVGSWILTITFVPSIWALLVMAGILWAYVRYFSGSWWPQSTILFRKTNFRSIKLSKRLWKWGLISAGLFVLIFQSGLMVTFRFIQYPAELFKSEYNFDTMSIGVAWVGLIMASFEKKYGPKTAIAIVSLVFVVVHLHQAWAWPILFQIIAASAILGILAYRTGSLIPGIIAHAVMDVFNFSYWWSDVLGKFEERPISEVGIDRHFIVWSLVLLVSMILFFWSTGRAKNLKQRVKQLPYF